MKSPLSRFHESGRRSSPQQEKKRAEGKILSRVAKVFSINSIQEWESKEFQKVEEEKQDSIYLMLFFVSLPAFSTLEERRPIFTEPPTPGITSFLSSDLSEERESGIEMVRFPEVGVLCPWHEPP